MERNSTGFSRTAFHIFELAVKLQEEQRKALKYVLYNDKSSASTVVKVSWDMGICSSIKCWNEGASLGFGDFS